MSRCAACGLENPEDVSLCLHHDGVYGGHDWAASNRIMCDFVHRKRIPRRLTRDERDDDLVASVA